MSNFPRFLVPRVFLFLVVAILFPIHVALPAVEAAYPPLDLLRASPGGASYHVDPVGGDDGNDGTSAEKAWKTFARVNALKLAPGDRVMVSPGDHRFSLRLTGEGTSGNPIVIRFLPGRHRIAADGALRRAWFVSNACDDPALPRPVGMVVEKARHLRIEGGGARGPARTEVVFGGRMIQFVNEYSEDILWQGLVFDLERPTVSEFRVVESGPSEAVVRVAEGSTYRIENGVFSWTGDLGSGPVMVQEAIPGEGKCRRLGMKAGMLAEARAERLEDGMVRFVFRRAGEHWLSEGRQFQFRHTTRDTVGAHNNRCRNLVFRDCVFHALTGMGIVSQFSENIVLERVFVVPPEGSSRTCPAWADAFHFSGCRGAIRIEGCRFSGLQDDPVNVHGTFLRIMDRPAPNQLRLAFMHRQTYGFAPFQPGDEVAVLSHETLRELPGNPRRGVKAIEGDPADASGKQWLVTLDGPAPEFAENDVLDNLSWYPDVTIRDCHVSYSSCRGFLLTTRGRAVVENCVFDRTAMAAILVESDAAKWFESGPVRDLLIRNNRFVGSGIKINPQTANQNPEEPVHENIRIIGNSFDGGGIFVKNTSRLVIRDNRFRGDRVDITVEPSCAEPDVSGNLSGSD